jgi:hypothetical protein
VIVWVIGLWKLDEPDGFTGGGVKLVFRANPESIIAMFTIISDLYRRPLDRRVLNGYDRLFVIFNFECLILSVRLSGLCL